VNLTPHHQAWNAVVAWGWRLCEGPWQDLGGGRWGVPVASRMRGDDPHDAVVRFSDGRCKMERRRVKAGNHEMDPLWSGR
jgi:hypothetical protein